MDMWMNFMSELELRPTFHVPNKGLKGRHMIAQAGGCRFAKGEATPEAWVNDHPEDSPEGAKQQRASLS